MTQRTLPSDSDEHLGGDSPARLCLVHSSRYARSMNDVIVYGLGELGRLLAGGALRCGYRVLPITRQTNPQSVLDSADATAAIVVAVGESELPDVLTSLPGAARDRVVLLQNELFPDIWLSAGASAPTVMVPWLLQKASLPQIQMQPTPVYGRYADLLAEIHQALGLGAHKLSSEPALEDALAAKYALIVCINALGSIENRTMGQWLHQAPSVVAALTTDATQVAYARFGRAGEAEDHVGLVLQQVRQAMKTLSSIPSAGRTAKLRVERALSLARRFDVETPALSRVSSGQLPGG